MAGLLTVGAVLAGCSSGGGTSSSGGMAAPAGAKDGIVSAPERSVGSGSPSGGGTGDVGANRTVVHERDLIRTGEITLTSRHLGQARAEVDRLLTAFGGSIDTEQTSHRRDGAIDRSVLVVRVPTYRFKAAMEAFGKVGRVRHADSSTQNVTQDVIDVRERLLTLDASLDRLRAFQKQTTDVTDLIRLEQEITARESERQSLQAQQDYLANQTSMSTITLTMTRPEPAPPGPLDHAGFLAGLRAGWHALTDTVVVALTAVGAALPFAGVLALLGAPALLLLRRVLRSRRTAPAEPVA